ncbi:hypothetical protein B5M42_007285 [Paenibacillus athensensis]|uniref:Uncharacterized protein n=1 Tax=Paenibacillus athensensis TaxID=1967502 RepID=A0A4Y8Q292_9BACL|nr:CBO0543 family protein [Paenibacillus athensensis]MCD1258635.1 hypothetical protein [Paenibacillus athensensis]
MIINRIVLAAAWLAALTILVVAYRRGRLPEALIQLMATQVLTWTLSLIFVNFHFMSCPVREFPRATDSNFTFNYMFYPSINVLFSLFYPRIQAWLPKLAYHVLFSLGMFAFSCAVERHTELLQYGSMHGLMRILVFWLGLNATRLYGDWFFKPGWLQSGKTA